MWLTTGVVFLGKTMFVTLLPLRSLGSIIWLLDDSFIEMRVARNLALGGGFSLDGIHATTGAPFLWIYLTSLNHSIFWKEAAIRATLIESAIFGSLACVIVYYIARKITADTRVAWTSFFLCTFTANAFFNAMNGMDTTLFTFLVLLSIALCLGVGKPARMSPFLWGCFTGLASGATMMTRGDGLFLFLGILSYLFYEWITTPRTQRQHIRQMAGGILLVSGICFGLFMIWQLSQTGSPFPGNQVGRRGLSLALHNFSFDHFSLPRYLAIVVWNVFQLEDLLSISMGGFLLASVAFVSGSLQKNFRPLSIISTVYLGTFFLLLVAYQWYFPDVHGLRYVNPAVHIFFIYIAYLLWNLPIKFWQKQAVALLILWIAILASYRHYQLASRLPWAPYMSYLGYVSPEKSKVYWGAIDWVRDNLPPNTVIGARDYGRISLFTEARIQDLAGNIDPQVAVALNNGTLKEYLKERKVQYLYIPPPGKRPDKLYEYLYAHLKLERVKEAPEAPTQSLYKIVWE